MINGEGAYIIDEANAGLSCNSGDFKQLASNVLRLYNENSNTLKIMGENARKYSETNFSRSLLLDRFEEVFSKLA
jgi:glycosyltransferase involved in cell wall biosynthesis